MTMYQPPIFVSMQVTLPPALVIHQPHQVRQLQPTTCCSCACINDLQACVITAWASCGGVQRYLASGPSASVVCLSALGTDMVHAALQLAQLCTMSLETARCSSHWGIAQLHCKAMHKAMAADNVCVALQPILPPAQVLGSAS